MRRVSLLLAGIIAVMLGFSHSAVAQGTRTDAYLIDSRGHVVKGGFDQCWRTRHWTADKAIAECDPHLVAKPAPMMPEPVATPEPVVTPPPVAVAPALVPAPKPMRVERVTLEADANFDFDKSDLKPGDREDLDKLAERLRGIEIESIVVTGHTDSIGSTEWNHGLSLRRAEAVKAYLVRKGVDANKIRIVGRGESDPIADNSTAQGRAENRRAEVEITGERSG